MRRFTLLAIFIISCLVSAISQDPVASWPLDGDAIAEVGDDGTLHGAVPATDRYNNPTGALAFDGIDDYVRLPDSVFYQKKPFTISIWFKTTNEGGIMGYSSGPPTNISANHVGQLYVGNSGALHGKYWDDVTDPINGPVVNDGQWHQVVLTRDIQGQDLYLDGTHVGSRSAATFDLNMARSYIGTALTDNWIDSPDGFFYFEGCLDDLNMYNEYLTQEDVTDLYQREIIGIVVQDSFCIYCDASNTSVGFNALSPERGYGNTVIGAFAGHNSSGTGNVFMGHKVGAQSDVSNQLMIGNGEFSPLVLGNFEARTFGVDGEIITREITVDYDNWPDYVFSRDYKLRPLQELEKFLDENKHLPGVPSQDEIHADGINLGEMDATLLQKIEELTLYMIELRKENEDLKIQHQEMQGRYQEMEERLRKLEE